VSQAARAENQAPDAARVDVRLVDLTRRFGDVAAVDSVTVDVARGEFFTLLGPSGSGKTTTLRLIAGFEQPDAGRIELAGTDVTGRPPYARDVNTVFQDYALFPHMTVRENVEYGLRIKKVAREQRRTRAEEALAMVRLEDFGARKPAQLSGGQRQRVALARAIVNRPQVLLLDEPLGALDLKLRQEMQIELKGIQRDVGITFLFVTHDQEEALTMSDRIAVFNAGRIEQVGTAADVYERPATSFVAGFVGTSNLMSGESAKRVLGHDGTWTVRPEKIRLEPAGTPAAADEHCADGTVAEVIYLGSLTRFVVSLDAGGELVAMAQNVRTTSSDVEHFRQQRVRLLWSKDHVYRVNDTR